MSHTWGTRSLRQGAHRVFRRCQGRGLWILTKEGNGVVVMVAVAITPQWLSQDDQIKADGSGHNVIKITIGYDKDIFYYLLMDFPCHNIMINHHTQYIVLFIYRIYSTIWRLILHQNPRSRSNSAQYQWVLFPYLHLFYRLSLHKLFMTRTHFCSANYYQLHLRWVEAGSMKLNAL